MTKARTRVISDDYVAKPSVPYGDLVGVRPLITPPKIRRERTRLIELLVDKLQNYDACVRALAKGEISPSTLCDADYDLALTLNHLCYFDSEEGEVRGEYYDSQSIIWHYEREVAKAKARRDRKRKAA
jgi:hypothetical protein